MEPTPHATYDNRLCSLLIDDKELNFQVHIKEKQELKYLNKGSSHTHACFESIRKGVSGRLAKLTSKTNDTENVELNKLYPFHAKIT